MIIFDSDENARAAGIVFAFIAVAAFVGAAIVDAVRPDYSEGWGLLLVLIAFLAAPIAAGCGVVIAIRVYQVHKTRLGLAALLLAAGTLFTWLMHAMFVH